MKSSLTEKLPPGIIALDITHRLKHIQPRELIIPLLNISNKEDKIPVNTFRLNQSNQ